MKRTLLVLLLAGMMGSSGICLQPNADFSGTWKQSDERSTPARTGNVILHIDHRDPDLTVVTTIQRGSAAPRHALQHYTTDGKSSISTGADGDEFHTSVVWSGQGLLFSVEEHEEGRIILSQETWTLIENGAALERCRERAGSRTGKETIMYIRESPVVSKNSGGTEAGILVRPQRPDYKVLH
jgi:hypothetical protein